MTKIKWKRYGKVVRRPGTKLIYAAKKDEQIVGMTVFRNRIVVATTKQVLMYPKSKSTKKNTRYCKCKYQLQGIFGLQSRLYLCRNCGWPIKEKQKKA